MSKNVDQPHKLDARAKIRIVLNALMLGKKVCIGNMEYQQHPKAANFFVCQVARSYSAGEDIFDPSAGKDKHLGGDDIPLNFLMNEIISMPDDQVTILAAENVLTENNCHRGRPNNFKDSWWPEPDESDASSGPCPR